MRKILLFILFLLVSINSYSFSIYKTTDNQGNVTFSNRKTPDAISVTLEPVQTISMPKAKINNNSIIPHIYQHPSALSINADAQKRNDLDKRVKQFLELQKVMTTFSQRYEQAIKNYEEATKTAIKAKRDLDYAIADNKNFINKKLKIIETKKNNELIYRLSQKSIFANRQKQQAGQELENAKQALEISKNNILNFYKQ